MSQSQPTRLEIRFGDEILDAGFTVVPNLILRHYAHLGITPAEMMFTIHVWEFWWSVQEPYPSLATIADRMNMTRRNIRKYVQSLRDKEYLIVTERFNSNGQTSSEYDFSPLLRAVLDRSATLGTDDPTPLRTNDPRGTEQIDRAPGNVRSSEEDTLEEDESEELIRKNLEIFVSDFGRELRDQAPRASSLTRLVRLFERSSVELPEFIEAMYEARRRTQQATNVSNRFTYWIATLENLLENE